MALDKVINVVCFKPDYLFGDLVQRFVDLGCVATDYPMQKADAYIWMRPQELLFYTSLVKGSPHRETGARYLQEFKAPKNANTRRLVSSSIVIHHGTCHEPIYQFNHAHIGKALRHVKRVFGVCDFTTCYGPSASIASETNFELLPIGFDEQVFSPEKIRQANHPQDKTLTIGFVGRAYGQLDYKKSRMITSHPLGYRKGGDILLNTVLRLKARDIKTRLVILGQRWDPFIEQMEKYGLPYDYHTRDSNLGYTDYPDVFNTFDLLFIGARCEGGPVTALEALSLGVPVVSTNVGIINHLSKVLPEKYCRVFDYDIKWGIADYEVAISHIEEIAKKRTNYEERKAMRKSVGSFTTQNWAARIFNFALGET